AIGKQDESR
ncbi:hypothetical protein VCHC59B1_3391B, partial [Vibrio cholerae HC-59B1]